MIMYVSFSVFHKVTQLMFFRILCIVPYRLNTFKFNKKQRLEYHYLSSKISRKIFAKYNAFYCWWISWWIFSGIYIDLSTSVWKTLNIKIESKAKYSIVLKRYLHACTYKGWVKFDLDRFIAEICLIFKIDIAFQQFDRFCWFQSTIKIKMIDFSRFSAFFPKKWNLQPYYVFFNFCWNFLKQYRNLLDRESGLESMRFSCDCFKKVDYHNRKMLYATHSPTKSCGRSTSLSDSPAAFHGIVF